MKRPGSGGNSSDISAITVGSLAAMITDLENRSKTLQSLTSLKRRAGEYGVGMTEFQKIMDVGRWIDGELPMLRRRLSLARALESQASPGRPVSLHEPVRLPTEAELTRMRNLAKKLKEHTKSGPENAKLYHEAALALASVNDPDLAAAFFAELGPQSIELLVPMMSGSGSKTIREDVKAFSTALGVAFKDTDPSQGIVDVMNMFANPPTKNGAPITPAAWGRLALLQDGDFDPTWLTKVVRANGLDAFARKGHGGISDFRGNMSQDTGLPDDIIALAFGALKNNPEAARSAITSMGPMSDTVKLVFSYAGAVGTGESVAQNFGLAIEAGTGSTTEKSGAHSEAAAKFAFDFILATGQYKQVPYAIKPSLGRLAASYTHELLTGARTDDGGARDSGVGKPADFNTIPGITPRFYLSAEDTYRFLHGFADSDVLSEPFDEAMGNLYQAIAQLAAQQDRDAIKAGGRDPRNFERTMDAFGSLGGLQYQAMKDVRGSMDAFDKKVRENISKVVTLGIGKVPTPTGVAAKWAWKGVTKAAGAGLKKFVKGGATRVQILESEDLQETLTMKYQTAALLVAAGYPHKVIPPDIRGADGNLLSVDEIVKDEKKLARFFAWSDSNDEPPYVMDDKIDQGEKNYVGGSKVGEKYGSTLQWK
ncbi:hypothetical protein E1263_19995 [Kribbella antibiotica]|uniref:Uncharacterized protein n=1 Tax=Kribbella antibiotica TaxID=190195 RepID=A0A4R4ZL01_9ACTN|nr:hypothetical protein [Kribbella antibiotica]TDD58299.1 hypothetical protein E1263_19995 [Kribbella antibiotica]